MMVRNYEKSASAGGGTNRLTWSEDVMTQALSDVVTGKMGYKLAARYYQIPRSTLQRRVAKYKESGNSFVKKPIGNFKRVFTEEQEEDIVKNIKIMEEQMKNIKNITKKDIREIAFHYAIEKSIKHPFDLNSKMAGEDWLRGFLTRHPQVLPDKKAFPPIPIKLPANLSSSLVIKKVENNNNRKINPLAFLPPPPKKQKLEKKTIAQVMNDEFMFDAQYPNIDYDQFFHFMSHYRK